MDKYSIIVFDLGNVLIPFDYAKMIDSINKVQSELGNKFKMLYQENYHIHRKYEKGYFTDEEFLEIMLEWLEQKIDRQEFCKIFSDIFTLNEDVIALLPALREKYRLVLLSNTNQIHKVYGWQQFPFLQYFEKQVLSHEVKAVKPEERIYRAVEEFTKEPSNKHFFIDDIYEYVQGAWDCGWGGTQFENYEKLVFDLKLKQII